MPEAEERSLRDLEKQFYAAMHSPVVAQTLVVYLKSEGIKNAFTCCPENWMRFVKLTLLIPQHSAILSELFTLGAAVSKADLAFLATKIYEYTAGSASEKRETLTLLNSKHNLLQTQTFLLFTLAIFSNANAVADYVLERYEKQILVSSVSFFPVTFMLENKVSWTWQLVQKVKESMDEEFYKTFIKLDWVKRLLSTTPQFASLFNNLPASNKQTDPLVEYLTGKLEMKSREYITYLSVLAQYGTPEKQRQLLTLALQRTRQLGSPAFIELLMPIMQYSVFRHLVTAESPPLLQFAKAARNRDVESLRRMRDANQFLAEEVNYYCLLIRRLLVKKRNKPDYMLNQLMGYFPDPATRNAFLRVLLDCEVIEKAIVAEADGETLEALDLFKGRASVSNSLNTQIDVIVKNRAPFEVEQHPGIRFASNSQLETYTPPDVHEPVLAPPTKRSCLRARAS